MAYRGEMIGLHAILFRQRPYHRHSACSGQLPIRGKLRRGDRHIVCMPFDTHMTVQFNQHFTDRLQKWTGRGLKDGFPGAKQHRVRP
jgi:hypothetical protein